VVTNVATIFTQVDGDTVGSVVFGDVSSVQRARVAPPSGVTKGGDVVYVNTKQNHNRGQSSNSLGKYVEFLAKCWRL
jgi:hypothetical protein